MIRPKRLLLILLVTILAGCATAPEETGTQRNESTTGDEPVVIAPKITLKGPDERKILQQILDAMRPIPAGEFQMGDTLGEGEDDEGPVRTVQVHAFALSQFEVTFEQYALYARSTGEDLPKARWGGDNRPVVDVTWHDAMGFIDWLTGVTGVPFRLPSEAEWEYAARAGRNDASYSFGNNAAALCEYANIADQSTTIGWRNRLCHDGYETTAPVGSFKPNAYGLYDMHGNVWEWLADCWHHNYKGAPMDSSPREKSSGCSIRVQRGGSWFYGASEARVTYRSKGNDLDKSVTLGFRLAHDR